MAGFSSVDDMISEITVNGKILTWDFTKYGPTAKAAGAWTRLHGSNGSPGAGAEPASTPGAAHTNLAGSMNWANVSPDTKHLLSFSGMATQDCTLMLYDRLSSVGAVSIGTTGAKTVNSTALPRYSGTDAAVVEVWLEVTTAVSAGTPVITMSSYTNEAGTAAQTGPALTFPNATPTANYMVQLPIATGDKGVRSVEQINVGTLGTSGVVNVVLLRRIAEIPLVANQSNTLNFALEQPAFPRVFDGASLGLMFLASTTTAPNVFGKVTLAYG